MARQWRTAEVRLRDVARGRGRARQARRDLLQCERSARGVQEEQTRWEAVGVRWVCAAETIDLECMGKFMHCVHATIEDSHAALWRRDWPRLAH